LYRSASQPLRTFRFRSQPPPHRLKSHRPLPDAAAAYEFKYSSASSQSSYILNTNPLSQVDAEQFCRDNGMHLVTWESAAEQNEVGPHG
jgi:hypothetical protein